MDQLVFPLAPEFRGNHRQSCRQSNQYQSRRQEQCHQDVTLLVSPAMIW
jgi:hypothetical protein